MYNDICGKYEDFLNCFIEGLEPKRFPTIINITGSPLILSPN